MVLISESWMAPAKPDKPYMRVVDSPDRKEFLTAAACSKDGEPILLRAEILRDNKMVKLGETHEEFGGAHFAFAPLYEVWRKSIPAQWIGMRTGADEAKKE